MVGPSGAGKKTIISCFLKEIFGSAVERMKIDTQIVETPSNKKVEFKTMSSNHHIEINPCDVGIYDRLVIQQLVKMNASVGVLGGGQDAAAIKVVVITEADRLTREAQAALRRIMEKYSGHFRTILCAESASRLIPAIKSRVLIVRVSAPSVDDITKIVMAVSKKENAAMNQAQAEFVAKHCDRNLRRGLMAAETIKVTNDPMVSPCLPQWQMFVKALAKKILRDQNPAALDKIRSDLYQLLAHMVSPDILFRFLVKEVLELTTDYKQQYLHGPCIELASFYEYRSRLGSKPVIHIEAFIAQFMTYCITIAEERKKSVAAKK